MTALRPLGTLGLLALSVGTFTLGVDGFVLAGLLPQVSASLHVSAGTAGQLTTVFALVYAFGSPVIAATAGNWDRRRLLAVGMVVFAAGIVLQATGPSFAVVVVGRVVAALGAAAYQATAYSTAGILSDDAHRARSLAVVAGGSSVAIVAGLPFGLLIGQAWGWRAAMWVLLALALVSLLAIRFLEPVYAPRLTLRQRGAVLADRRVAGILAGTVAVLTPGFLVLAYLPAILQTSGLWVVLATLAYGAGQVAGTALVPRLIARRGARRTLQLGAVGVTAISAALTVTCTLHPAATVTMAALGLAIGLTVVPQQHRLFATVPARAPIAVGLNGSAIYIGSALGASVGGLALTVGGGNAPTLVAAIIGALAVGIVTIVRPARGQAARSRRGRHALISCLLSSHRRRAELGSMGCGTTFCDRIRAAPGRHGLRYGSASAALTEAATQLGPQAAPFAGDVSNLADIDALFAKLRERGAALDVVFANDPHSTEYLPAHAG